MTSKKRPRTTAEPLKQTGVKANKKRTKVPIKATDLWQGNGSMHSTLAYIHRKMPPPAMIGHQGTPNTLHMLKEFQKYANGNPVRTVGHNVLYRGTQDISKRNLVTTSTHPRIGHRYSREGGKLYRVHVPPHTPFIPITGNSYDEHEFLLPPGRLVVRENGKSEKLMDNDHGSFRARITDADYVPSMTKNGHFSFHPVSSDTTLSFSDGSDRSSRMKTVTVSQQSRRDSPTTSTANSARQKRVHKKISKTKALATGI